MVINTLFAYVHVGREGCTCTKTYIDLIVCLRNTAARMQGWTLFLPKKGLSGDPVLWS